jgi:ubiquinone/menaquinone biosynthesis C-methylase UbiE
MPGTELDIVRKLRAVPAVGRKQVPGVGLVGVLWWYAGAILYPAQLLKRRGVPVVGDVAGTEPVGLPRPGAGPRFSDRHPDPVLMDEESQNAHLVDDFDRLAVWYDALVRPFSAPVFDEALRPIAGYLAPDSRVLDLGCGPGRELRRVAALVPDGEVVGADLAPGMIRSAHAAARREGIGNCAFFQADAGRLPSLFDGAFDMVYSSLAHHHFPDPEAAARSALRCLRPGGVYCIVDPGPRWFTTLSAPLGRLADPGWIGWHTPEEFRMLLTRAGFATACWMPLLPGLGLAVGQKQAGVT